MYNSTISKNVNFLILGGSWINSRECSHNRAFFGSSYSRICWRTGSGDGTDIRYSRYFLNLGSYFFLAVGRAWEYFTYMVQGESKKSVIGGVWCKIVLFLCNRPKWYLSIFLDFFGTLKAQKKSKNVYIY